MLSRKSHREEPQVPMNIPANVPMVAPAPVQVNMISAGTIIEGVVRAKNDTSISGKVIGKIFVDGRLNVLPDGHVEGEVNATNADISGKVVGDVIVADKLRLKGSGIVDGNIKVGKLIVEDGATFTGKCDMGGNNRPQAAPATPVANNKVSA